MPATRGHLYVWGGFGNTIPADLVVMAAGIRPNTELAESAGIACNRGILVNDTMQT